MDIYDQATQQEELARSIALSAIRSRANGMPQLIPVGTCYNCNSSVSASLLFCDADCRDDWQHRNK